MKAVIILFLCAAAFAGHAAADPKPAKVKAALMMQLASFEAAAAAGDTATMITALCPVTTLLVPASPAVVLRTVEEKTTWAETYVALNVSSRTTITLGQVTVAEPKGENNERYQVYVNAIYSITTSGAPATGKAILNFEKAPKSPGEVFLGKKKSKTWCLKWAIWNSDGPPATSETVATTTSTEATVEEAEDWSIMKA